MKVLVPVKRATDNDMNATGQMLSAMLGWSRATFASELDIDGDNWLRSCPGGCIEGQ